MNPISSDNEYRYHRGHQPQTQAMLSPLVLHYARQGAAKRVLDIGCGNGHMCGELNEQGIEVVGIDPSQSGIDEARALCPSVTFHTMGIYDPPQQLGSECFDFACALEVVEHLYHPRELPRFAAALLRPGGLLLLSTPYHGWLKNLLIALLGKWDHHHSPLWDGGHIKFWSKATLSQLLHEEGFEVLAFHGCGRLPWLWKSMVLVARKR